MTDAEASTRAHAAGLLALVDASGWCLLVLPGVRMEARGGTWEEAFANLDRAREAEAREAPAAVLSRQPDLWEAMP